MVFSSKPPHSSLTSTFSVISTWVLYSPSLGFMSCDHSWTYSTFPFYPNKGQKTLCIQRSMPPPPTPFCMLTSVSEHTSSEVTLTSPCVYCFTLRTPLLDSMIHCITPHSITLSPRPRPATFRNKLNITSQRHLGSVRHFLVDMFHKTKIVINPNTKVFDRSWESLLTCSRLKLSPFTLHEAER